MLTITSKAFNPTIENATQKKPVSVNTISTFSKPSLTNEMANSLLCRALARGYRSSDLMITCDLTKEAFKALSLTPPQTPTPLVSEKVSTNPHLQWNLVPCKIINTDLKMVITKTHAIYICQPTNEQEYYRALQNEEAIADKINPSNEKIGLTSDKITRLGRKEFYLYEHDKNPKKFYGFRGFSHITEARLKDCAHTTFSSKEELLKAASYLIHQVDILHREGIYHMDIKPHNISKTKDGRFKVIDRYGSLDFTKQETMSRVQNENFWITRYMIPKSLFDDLVATKTTSEATKIAKAADIFATGSTIYQMAFAFMNNKCLKESHYSTRLPYNLAPNGHPFCLLPPEKFNTPLKALSSNQQQLIRRSLLALGDNQPTLKELKEAFPC